MRFRPALLESERLNIRNSTTFAILRYVFCALHDQLASLGRHAQLTRSFSAVAELLVGSGHRACGLVRSDLYWFGSGCSRKLFYVCVKKVTCRYFFLAVYCSCCSKTHKLRCNKIHSLTCCVKYVQCWIGVFFRSHRHCRHSDWTLISVRLEQKSERYLQFGHCCSYCEVYK